MVLDDQITAFRKAINVVVPGSGPVTDLIAALIGLGAVRDAQLNRLELKIDDVRDAPFKRGQALLAEARALGGNSNALLGQAADKFGDAHATYQREPELSCWAAMNVSSLQYALGNRASAQHWLVKAHTEAVKAIEARCAMAGRVSVGKITVPTEQAAAGSKWVASALAGGVGLIVFILLTGIAGPKIGAAAGVGGFIASFFVAGAAYSGLESAGNAATEALERRYNQRLAAAQQLAEFVRASETFGTELNLNQTTMPRYKLEADSSSLEIKYLQITTAQV